MQAIDTTAAGDTFCGVLAAALSRGEALAAGLSLANAASALACTRLGAQSSIPTRAQVQAFLQDHAGVHSRQALEALSVYCGIG